MAAADRLTALGIGAAIVMAVIGGSCSTNARIDDVNARIGEVGAGLHARIDDVNARIDELREELGARLDRMEARLDARRRRDR